MISKIGSCVIIGVVLLVFAFDFFPRSAEVTAADQDAGSKAQSTRLMQQMDHQRRLRNEKEAEEAGKIYSDKVLPPGVAAEESAGFDLAVFVVLAVSAATLFIVCRIRGGSTRRCLSPPGTRSIYQPRSKPQPPSRD